MIGQQVAVIQHRRRAIQLLCVFIQMQVHLLPSPPIQRLHNPSFGATWREAMEGCPDITWEILFRMPKSSFNALVDWLAENTDLPQFCRADVCLREKLKIFLFIVSHGNPIRLVSFWFGRSWETVHRLVIILYLDWIGLPIYQPNYCGSSFHEVLNAMMRLAQHNIRMPTTSSEPPWRLIDNPKGRTFADTGCIGAIDGSFFPCRANVEDHPVYRNRHGDISFNVCAVVDFDGRYIYMLAGWEGSAHDMRVFQDAIGRDLRIPEGKYLLADAGYQPSHRLMTPYRGVRYHLQETARAGLRPVSPEELFNLRHSQFRICVEKTFGSHKNTFKILTKAPQHSVKTHMKVIYATAALLNWISDHGFVRGGEMPPNEADLDNYAGSGPTVLLPEEWDASEDGPMSLLRRDVGNRMWEQYRNVLEERGLAPLDPEG
jgi:hypothetical protein